MSENYLRMDPGEETLMVVRRHWINIFPILVGMGLLLLFAAFSLGWVAANTALIPPFIPLDLLTLGLLIIGGLAILITFIAFFIFRQNRIILTNRHYIQITQSGLFDRTVSKLTLDEIQDCRGTRKGFFATMLSYGEVLIETAGEEENFEFSPIRDPLNLAEAINDAHQKYGYASHIRAAWPDSHPEGSSTSKPPASPSAPSDPPSATPAN